MSRGAQWAGWDIRESPRWDNGDSQVHGESDMAAACVCTLGSRRAQQRYNACASIHLDQIVVSHALIPHGLNYHSLKIRLNI